MHVHLPIIRGPPPLRMPAPALLHAPVHAHFPLACTALHACNCAPSAHAHAVAHGCLPACLPPPPLSTSRPRPRPALPGNVLSPSLLLQAYYIDVQNRRADYITTFLEKLVDWDAVAARFTAAKA